MDIVTAAAVGSLQDVCNALEAEVPVDKTTVCLCTFDIYCKLYLNMHYSLVSWPHNPTCNYTPNV